METKLRDWTNFRLETMKTERTVGRSDSISEEMSTLPMETMLLIEAYQRKGREIC